MSLSIPAATAAPSEPRSTPLGGLWRKYGLFASTVLAPTLLAAAYFGLIASDVYVSESSFVVRSQERQVPNSALGVFLKGSGYNIAQDDTYTVQEYLTSRDALKRLNEELAFKSKVASPDIDFLSRYGGWPWPDSFERLYLYYKKKVEIAYSSSSSISTLTVRAYAAKDVVEINEFLLRKGEELVNRLNERARRDMIRFATEEVRLAEQKARDAASALALYREQKGVIDPVAQATLQLQQIAKLQDDLMATRMQIAQLTVVAPANPQLAVLRERVKVLEAQIDQENKGVTSGARSLSNKATEYQRLAFESEFASKQLAGALAALEQARSEAVRQQLYLERISQPVVPDEAMEPRRIRGIFTVLVCGLLVWGALSLLISSIREHRN